MLRYLNVHKIKLSLILIIIFQTILISISGAEAEAETEKVALTLRTFSIMHVTWKQYLSIKDDELVAAISTDSRYAFHTIRSNDGLITTHSDQHETCPERLCISLRARASYQA